VLSSLLAMPWPLLHSVCSVALGNVHRYEAFGSNVTEFSFCSYVKRKAMEEFRASRGMAEAERERLWQRALDEFQVMKRQSIVYQMYGRKHQKNVMVGDASCCLPSSVVFYVFLFFTLQGTPCHSKIILEGLFSID
jgi:hypothetical protein